MYQCMNVYINVCICMCCIEWDSKYSGGVNWRQKIDTQKGAVLATELKNNSCKLAKWTAQAGQYIHSYIHTHIDNFHLHTCIFYKHYVHVHSTYIHTVYTFILIYSTLYTSISTIHIRIVNMHIQTLHTYIFNVQALLSGAHQLKLGYVSRVAPSNPYEHVVLGTQSFKPKVGSIPTC